MAHTKAGGSTQNNRDSNAQYLGVKRSDGSKVRVGMVIVRQRGTKMMAGKNVKVAKDHTLFAMKDGVVKFRNARKANFDGRTVVRKVVDVV